MNRHLKVVRVLRFSRRVLDYLAEPEEEDLVS